MPVPSSSEAPAVDIVTGSGSMSLDRYVLLQVQPEGNLTKADEQPLQFGFERSDRVLNGTEQRFGRGDTRIEAAFSWWIRLMTCGCSSLLKANWRAVRAPSVAYPLPQKDRRSIHPSSNPGHPSGFQKPMRPTKIPEDRSSAAQRP